jgi:dTDP-4-dehydrorhamnose reductase
MKKILITGSNGLLGRKLIDKLISRNDIELIATGRGENRNPIKTGYTYYSLDITIEQQIEDVFDSVSPDIVIHTAAMTNVDECELNNEACYQQNVLAVQYLSNTAEKRNIHLIHLSTDFIFDGLHGPYDEEASPNPLSYYAESKVKAEELVMKMKTAWSIVRTILVYGVIDHGSRSNVVLWVKNNLEQKKNINVVNDQFRTPTLAEDLAEGCILIADKRATGIYNIAGPDFMSIYELALVVAEFFNLDKSLVYPSTSELVKQPAKRPAKTGLLIDKAIKNLGYQPHSFKDSLILVADQLK